MRLLKLSTLILALLTVSGCASFVPAGETPDPDPFEYTNRKIFRLNQELDKILFKPAAKGYQKVTNKEIRQGFRNFFSNVKEVPTAVNETLQGKFGDAGVSLARFGINTTVGVLGFIDVADRLGIEQRYATFGETMQFWGATYSPYLMFPVLGPSTVRDTAGRFVDSTFNPFLRYADADYHIPYYFLYGVSVREALLKNDKLVDVLSFDEYIFVRNAYLQRTEARVGGKPASQKTDDEETFDDEFAGEFE